MGACVTVCRSMKGSVASARSLPVRCRSRSPGQAVGSGLLPSWFIGQPLDEKPQVEQDTVNIIIFNLWLCGNIVEAVQVLMMRYKADVVK